jgi:hypothetical protein
MNKKRRKKIGIFLCNTSIQYNVHHILKGNIYIYKYIYITKTRIYDLIVLEGWMLGFCKRCAGFIETIKPSHLQAPATQVQSHRPSSQLSHVHNHSFITTNINQVHNHHPNSRTSLQYHSHFSNFKGISLNLYVLGEEDVPMSPSLGKVVTCADTWGWKGDQAWEGVCSVAFWKQGRRFSTWDRVEWGSYLTLMATAPSKGCYAF